MRTMENLFFELLQLALGIREGLSRKLTVEEWRKVYEEATRQQAKQYHHTELQLHGASAASPPSG